MKVLVCGGRDFDNHTFAWDCLNKAHAKKPITLVISGGASGADSLAEQWADGNLIHCAVVKAIWHPFGGSLDKGAGPKRNAAMLALSPDGVIAFPGASGTADMVRRARAAGIKVWEPKP